MTEVLRLEAGKGWRKRKKRQAAEARVKWREEEAYRDCEPPDQGQTVGRWHLIRAPWKWTAPRFRVKIRCLCLLEHMQQAQRGLSRPAPAPQTHPWFMVDKSIASWLVVVVAQPS